METAQCMKTKATKRGLLSHFLPPEDSMKSKKSRWDSDKAHYKVLGELIACGIGVHHAGDYFTFTKISTVLVNSKSKIIIYETLICCFICLVLFSS